MEMNQKTLIIDNEDNIYSPDPFAEYSSLSEATILQGAYELRSIQPTANNIVTLQGGQTREINVSQDTKKHQNSLRKGKKCTMQLFSTCLNMFCFICLFLAAGVTYCKIFQK